MMLISSLLKLFFHEEHFWVNIIFLNFLPNHSFKKSNTSEKNVIIRKEQDCIDVDDIGKDSPRERIHLGFYSSMRNMGIS